MRDVCESFGAELREFNGEGDHVHLLVHYPPKVALSELVNSLKGVSSRYLRAQSPGAGPTGACLRRVLLAAFKGTWALADGRSPTARQRARIALLGASLTTPACRFVFADADADFAGRLVDRAAQTGYDRQHRP